MRFRVYIWNLSSGANALSRVCVPCYVKVKHFLLFPWLYIISVELYSKDVDRSFFMTVLCSSLVCHQLHSLILVYLAPSFVNTGPPILIED
jgi:hypothetical protein